MYMTVTEVALPAQDVQDLLWETTRGPAIKRIADRISGVVLYEHALKGRLDAIDTLLRDIGNYLDLNFVSHISTP